jgi:hypothetical protein
MSSTSSRRALLSSRLHGLLFSEQTTLSNDVHPGLFFATLWWVSVLWLTMVEGSQGSLVGLAPVDRELYNQGVTSNLLQVLLLAVSLPTMVTTLIGNFCWILVSSWLVVVMVFTINISGLAP